MLDRSFDVENEGRSERCVIVCCCRKSRPALVVGAEEEEGGMCIRTRTLRGGWWSAEERG